MSNLPIYYFSLFEMPKGVALKLEKIQTDFMRDGTRDIKKIHLFKWEDALKSKEEGGLVWLGFIIEMERFYVSGHVVMVWKKMLFGVSL